MKNSTFNLLVAVFCAACAAFGNQTLWIVVLNMSLAVVNLIVGINLHRQGR